MSFASVLRGVLRRGDSHVEQCLKYMPTQVLSDHSSSHHQLKSDKFYLQSVFKTSNNFSMSPGIYRQKQPEPEGATPRARDRSDHKYHGDML